MKYLVLVAMLVAAFAQQPAKAPEDKEASESDSAQSTAHAKSTKSNQDTSARPTPVPSDEDRSTQRKLTLFTAVLAGVGVLQLVVMFLTWLVYRRQAGIMEQQRATMQSQWTTMQDQLIQMKSGGEQTDKMIAQVTQQVGHLETSATAAKNSADILVMSERAWVEVHITKEPEVQATTARAKDGGPGPTTYQRVWFWPDVINVGRTPAKMTKIVIVTCEIPKPLGIHSQMPPELPKQPRYDADEQRRAIGIERDMMLAPKMGVTPLPIEVKGQEWERIMSRKSTLYLYGFVDYLDVVNKPHQTRFCEMYWVPFSRDDPNPPGFIVAGNTPAAYTECT
jgi:hypothetical protein